MPVEDHTVHDKVQEKEAQFMVAGISRGRQQIATTWRKTDGIWNMSGLMTLTVEIGFQRCSDVL